jgi:hypothetical protein
MPYDRAAFFDAVRAQPFGGELAQGQVDGMGYLIDVREQHFGGGPQAREWLAYCLATAYHETGAKMQPVEEIGRGDGKAYGEPVGIYGQTYYGRGHVQLTWEENYKKGEDLLSEKYDLEVPMHEYPHRMLEDEPSALVLYDGMIGGWFTGVGLAQFFNEDEEDPVGARAIVNDADKADTIAGYYRDFLAALKASAIA